MNTHTDLSSELIPDDAAFERMQQQLFDRIDAEEAFPIVQHVVPRASRKRLPKRAKRRRWVGLIAAAAVVGVTTTLVVTGALGPRAATAEAAEFLRGAAAATITSADPVVGPGEYLAVETTEAAMSFSDGYAYEDSQRVVMYVPHDRAGHWVLERQWLSPGKIYGDAERAQADIDSFWSATGREDVKLFDAQGGKFIMFGDRSGAELAALPTDPDALLTYLYEHAQGSSSKDEAVFVRVADLLRDGLVPAPLRAAMYKAIAQVPGVYLSDAEVNLDGHTGVAISRKDPSRSYTDQIIIDPTTGLLIGMRSQLVEAEGLLPAGTVLTLTAVKTSVVGEAPAGPYREQKPSG
ncbi:hypothetical protein GCM10022381_14330 [Leifsonia kafniensis]|uniref:CU044_5270 family protein n=1 Tax=Leifsonia kafniensis TaxID=475957 RepID=A0ABP7KDM2_9MICO